MATTLQTLNRRADELQGTYQYAFGGKPRITRRLSDMDKLINDTAQLLKEIERADRNGKLAKDVRERLAMYRSERANIVEAQKAGPEFRKTAMLASRANFTFSTYARYFAGQSRLTRDVGRLDDAITLLDEISNELGELVGTGAREEATRHLGVIEGNVALYASERDAIVAARNDADGEQRTSMYANVANAQFDIYRAHFAGKSRISRRPALLERVVENLAWCLDGMTQLVAESLEIETNEKNLAIVTERLGAYRAEVDAIRKARESASVFELIDALGQAANAVMAEYTNGFAGQDRATRDLALLNALIDQLLEIERQMWSIAKVYENGANERNLLIVHDTAMLYHREYDAIREVQKN